ncbi:MAG: hypothetical protein IT303_06285 [Dehalococcoidia bacterium]|nr:hypothetical protein [Dehalococcoidia bacterium]
MSRRRSLLTLAVGMAVGVATVAAFALLLERPGSGDPGPLFGMSAFGPGELPPETAVHHVTATGGAIVVGRVVELTDVRWTTADGKAPSPAAVTGDNPPPPDISYRVAVIEVDELLFGQSPRVMRLGLIVPGAIQPFGSTNQGEGWEVGMRVLVYAGAQAPTSKIAGADFAYLGGHVVEGDIAQLAGEGLPLAEVRARVQAASARMAQGRAAAP